MGSLTSMLMHMLFNVTVTINNLIVKLAAGGTMATLTCKSIMACTSEDGWQEELEVLPALLCCLNAEKTLLLIRAPASGQAPQQLMHPANAACNPDAVRAEVYTDSAAQDTALVQARDA